MTMTTAACAIAAALLAGTASFAAPAAAQSAPMSSSHAKKLFLSAVAVYDAGLRRGRANSSRNAYLRGFRDGTSTAAYSSRGPLVDSYAGYPIPSDSGYSSYGRDGDYYSRTGGYSSYDGRSVSYDDPNGYGDGRYDAGYAPRGLMNVAVAPLVATPYAAAQAAQWSYCAARYQSFDPVSGTFLAYDGNRHYCR